jgi:hypothetical protein
VPRDDRPPWSLWQAHGAGCKFRVRVRVSAYALQQAHDYCINGHLDLSIYLRLAVNHKVFDCGGSLWGHKQVKLRKQAREASDATRLCHAASKDTETLPYKAGASPFPHSFSHTEQDDL